MSWRTRQEDRHGQRDLSELLLRPGRWLLWCISSEGRGGWERENRKAQMPPWKKGDGHFLVPWERGKTHMGCEGEMFRPETNTYWKIEGLKVVRRGMTNRLSGQSPFSRWWHPYELLPALGRCFGRRRSQIHEDDFCSPTLLLWWLLFQLKMDMGGHLWVFGFLMHGIDCGGGERLDDKEGGLWELVILFAWSLTNEHFTVQAESSWKTELRTAARKDVSNSLYL